MDGDGELTKRPFASDHVRIDGRRVSVGPRSYALNEVEALEQRTDANPLGLGPVLLGSLAALPVGYPFHCSGTWGTLLPCLAALGVLALMAWWNARRRTHRLVMLLPGREVLLLASTDRARVAALHDEVVRAVSAAEPW